MTLSSEELARYARHIVLREIGGPGQQRLRAAKVAVVGAGGLGSPALLYLAAAGVGTLRIVDDDNVDLSNLQRQVIHGTGDLGAPKVESAAHRVASINPHVRLETHRGRLDRGNAAALIADQDVVLDGSDSFETRHAVNEAAVAAGVPLVSGSLSQWEGQVSVYYPARGGPCYACLFSEAPAAGLAPSCAEAGIMGALAGVIGSMMAGEAIKLITGAGQPLIGRLHIHDALWGEHRTIATKRQASCGVCGGIEG
ncbi:MAG: molybdopterin-synthase adenylyltransferase MoeB [Pseudomonadota bacterium]